MTCSNQHKNESEISLGDHIKSVRVNSLTATTMGHKLQLLMRSENAAVGGKLQDISNALNDIIYLFTNAK